MPWDFEMTSPKVSSTKIIVAVDGSNSTSKSDDLDIPEHCWVVKLANTVTFDRSEFALLQ
jgi:DNA polymerase alpha-associated DNA helicase A